MTYANPNIPTIPNPVFVDQAITTIQTKLGTDLTWLTKSFGRSYERVINRDGQEFREPMVYSANGEYIPMQYNDNIQAMSFFELGEQTPIDFSKFARNWYSIDLGIIFWVNLKRIDLVKSATYYFTEELKKDVRNILTNFPFGFDIEIESIEEDVDDIYSRYSFDQVTKQFFTYPYSGFKFNITITIQEQC